MLEDNRQTEGKFKHCDNFRGYLLGFLKNEVIIVRSRCKQWSCAYCAEVNAKQWRAIIFDAVTKIGGDWFMMTITAHRNARTRKNSLKNLQNGLNRLMKRIQRQLPDGFKLHYVRVYEPHKNGRVHAHFLINWRPKDYKTPRKKSDPGSRWLKDAAPACGLGHQVKIELLNGGAGLAAMYVTKYMTKSLEMLGDGVRRVQTTQGFKQPTDVNPSVYEWRVQEELLERDLFTLWRMGLTVIDIAHKHTITTDDIVYGEYMPNFSWQDE